MAQNNGLIEITEAQFRALDYSAVEASWTIDMSEEDIVRRLGSRLLTYWDLVDLGKKTGVTPAQIREKVAQHHNYKIVSDKSKEKIEFAQGTFDFY